MSTVFYGYRIKKTDWWNAYQAIRKEYWHGEKSATAVLFREMEKKNVTAGAGKRIDGLDESDEIFNKLHEWLDAEIQLFEFGDDYIFRVLERGWFFANSVEGMKLPITEVFVDTRTDWPKEIDVAEQTRLLDIVDEIDEKIRQHEYVIASIVSLEELKRQYFDRVFIPKLR